MSLMMNYLPLTDDDDDDEEEETVAQVAQPVQQAVAQSPISSDPPAVVAEEAIINVDANAVDGTLESDAKDPQQAALDQAATINNSIDPTGSEAIVDDEDDDDGVLLIFI